MGYANGAAAPLDHVDGAAAPLAGHEPAPGPSAPSTGHLKGIGFALLGLFLFAANNALMKSVVARFPVSEALAIRSAVSIVWLLPLLRAADLATVRRTRPGLHALRALISAGEMTCFFVAVSFLPLADVSVLYLATPIYVTALSPFLLKEHVGWRRWAAVLVGFAGVLVALHPDRGTFSAASLVALAGGVLFAFVVITTRGLRATPNRVLIAAQLGGALLVSLAMADRRWHPPGWADCGQLALTGTLSVLGYAAFNRTRLRSARAGRRRFAVPVHQHRLGRPVRPGRVRRRPPARHPARRRHHRRRRPFHLRQGTGAFVQGTRRRTPRCAGAGSGNGRAASRRPLNPAATPGRAGPPRRSRRRPRTSPP